MHHVCGARIGLPACPAVYQLSALGYRSDPIYRR